MNIDEFIAKLNDTPDSVEFSDTMAVIEAYYSYTPVAFKNGETENTAGSNEGSCKLFAFAQLQNFNKAQTLTCFGDYYRKDVLSNPGGSDHANIRNFMEFGWDGIEFSGAALVSK